MPRQRPLRQVGEAAASVDAVADRVLVLVNDPDELGRFVYQTLQAAILEAKRDADAYDEPADQATIIRLLVQIGGAILGR